MNDIFENIVGQSIAKANLLETFSASLKGAPLPRIFLDGLAGMGKTEFAKALGKAYELEGYLFKIVDISAIRLAGDEFRNLVETLQKPTFGGVYKGTILFFDECHKLITDKTKQIRLIYEAVLKICDGQSDNGYVQFDQDTLVSAKENEVGFIFASNLKGSFSRDGGAFLSRLSNIPLVPYTRDELIEILQGMLAKNGLRSANNETLKLIAGTGRGTARPMSIIAKKLKAIALNQGKNTVNRDDVLEAMRQERLFPYGLEVLDVRLLSLASHPKRDNVLCSLLNCETSRYKTSKAFLMGLGLLNQVSGGVTRTVDGSGFLENLKKEKFDLNF